MQNQSAQTLISSAKEPEEATKQLQTLVQGTVSHRGDEAANTAPQQRATVRMPDNFSKKWNCCNGTSFFDDVKKYDDRMSSSGHQPIPSTLLCHLPAHTARSGSPAWRQLPVAMHLSSLLRYACLCCNARLRCADWCGAVAAPGACQPAAVVLRPRSTRRPRGSQ